MLNSTKATTLNYGKETLEKAPGFLIIFLFICCAWIVIVNALVFASLVQNKRALKQFVNMQLLSLSMTDMLVGCSAITLILTFYKPAAFAHFGICIGIMYSYQTAQSATLFHAFGICIHRLITVKFYASGTQIFKITKTKRMLFQILIVWIVSIGLVAAPFSRYAEFGTSIKVCSLNTLFASNYKNFMAVLSAILFVPLVGMNLVYVYMLRFLLAKWGRINNNRTILNRSIIADEQKTEIRTHVCQETVQTKEASVPATRTDIRQETSASTSQGKSNSNNDLFSLPQSHNGPKAERAAHESGNSDFIFLSHIEEQQQNNTDCTVSANKDKPAQSLTGLKHTIRKTSFTTATQSQSKLKRNSVMGHKKQKHVLITIGIILLVLDMFMVPLILAMFAELLDDGLLSRRVKFSLMSLALVNNALNPVINALRIKPFKDVLSHNWDLFLSKVRS